MPQDGDGLQEGICRPMSRNHASFQLPLLNEASFWGFEAPLSGALCQCRPRKCFWCFSVGWGTCFAERGFWCPPPSLFRRRHPPQATATAPSAPCGASSAPRPRRRTGSPRPVGTVCGRRWDRPGHPGKASGVAGGGREMRQGTDGGAARRNGVWCPQRKLFSGVMAWCEARVLEQAAGKRSGSPGGPRALPLRSEARAGKACHLSPGQCPAEGP